MRCYERFLVKGVFGHRWDFRLHRKLLFDRVGFHRQIQDQVRFAKRLVFENRISLRDGFAPSAPSIAVLVTRGGCGKFLRPILWG